jgi:hypothetical protein
MPYRDSEYPSSTRAAAREGMRRAVERDKKATEGTNGKERSLD